LNKKLTIGIIKSVVYSLLILTITLALTLKSPNFSADASPGPTRVYLDEAANGEYMFDPATNGTLGTLFNVTVRMEDAEDCATFQVRMFYNDSIINVTRWYEPKGDSEYIFNGRTTLPVPPPPAVEYYHIGLGSASVTVGSAIFEFPMTGVTGSGKLCILEFEIIAVPPEGETYNCTLNIDNVDTFLLDSVGEEIPDVTEENGYYEIIPEFYSFLMLPIFLVITGIVIVFAKKKFRKFKVYTIQMNN